uniref:Uncharacterized protein n=1 Tax=Opuntia streptacantha TaxID=393608 RepID=A0A7C9D5X6_OPUST
MYRSPYLVRKFFNSYYRLHILYKNYQHAHHKRTDNHTRSKYTPDNGENVLVSRVFAFWLTIRVVCAIATFHVRVDCFLLGGAGLGGFNCLLLRWVRCNWSGI